MRRTAYYFLLFSLMATFSFAEEAGSFLGAGSFSGNSLSMSKAEKSIFLKYDKEAASVKEDRDAKIQKLEEAYIRVVRKQFDKLYQEGDTQYAKKLFLLIEMLERGELEARYQEFSEGDLDVVSAGQLSTYIAELGKIRGLYDMGVEEMNTRWVSMATDFMLKNKERLSADDRRGLDRFKNSLLSMPAWVLPPQGALMGGIGIYHFPQTMKKMEDFAAAEIKQIVPWHQFDIGAEQGIHSGVKLSGFYYVEKAGLHYWMIETNASWNIEVNGESIASSKANSSEMCHVVMVKPFVSGWHRLDATVYPSVAESNESPLIFKLSQSPDESYSFQAVEDKFLALPMENS